MRILISTLRILTSIQRYSRLIYFILCIFVIIAQACYMNYVYAHVMGLIWCLWSIADVLVVTAFICDFVISNRILKHIAKREASNISTTYPLSCLAWLIYSLAISLKIGILFGPNYNVINQHYNNIDASHLKFSIALSSVVFLLLVLYHHEKSPAHSYEVESFGKAISIDLLDTVQFLELLVFEETQIAMSYNMHYSIITVACMNIILPITMLISFSNTQFGKFTFGLTLEMVHLVYHSLLNVPMVVIRTITTSHFNVVTSVFLIKNIINIFLSVKNFISNVMYNYKDMLNEQVTTMEMDTLQGR